MSKFIKVTVSDQEFSSWKQLADTEGRSLANFVYQAMRDRVAGVVGTPVAIAKTEVVEVGEDFEVVEVEEDFTEANRVYQERKDRIVAMMQFLGNLAQNGATGEELASQRGGFAGLEVEFDAHMEKLVAHYAPAAVAPDAPKKDKMTPALKKHMAKLDNVLAGLKKGKHDRAWIEGIMNDHKRDKSNDDGSDGVIYLNNAALLDEYVEKMLADM